MFIEDDDWNDEADAQALSETILHKTLKSDCRARVKPKAVGRKSLLRTLQTLGPARQQPASEDARQDSDSDAEAASSPHKKKRKKKRSKRRKHAGVSGQETEEPEGGRGEQKRGDVPKKQKKKGLTSGSPKGKKMDPGGEEAKVESVELEVKKDENANQRSRKQWKNKMKNQRKCKNKYKQNTPKTELKTADPATSTEVIDQSKVNVCSEKGKKTSSQAPTQNKGKIKDREPLKRKRVEAAEHVSDTPDKKTTKLNTQPMEKEFRERNQITMDVLESSGQKPKCKLAQSVGETREENRTATSRRPKVEMSKEERRRREKLRKLRKLLHGEGSDTPPDPAEARTEHGAPSPPPPPGEGPEEAPASRSAALRSRMEQRLESARFRYINEVLYTTSSGEAKRMFKQDPGAFGIYHKGFTAQVQRWPENPVDNIIAFIQKRPASQVVADFGCGDCKIARSVKNKVHSFDLAAVCELVTVCDMANVPLGDGSVNIAVFCLSLMGTNLIDFLVEANRVLMMGGVLKVAEVASRFDNVRGFLTAVANLGFKMVKKDTENSHFYSFEFVKTKDAAENVKKSSLQLRPCVYKKR